ncbi:MAG: acyltransferase, partial [Dehalococcoidia bacterium]
HRLGVISYGVYLWHWPIFVLLTPDRVGIDGYALFALRVAVTLSAATASFALLESPIRRGLLLRSRAAWVVGPVAVASLAGLFVVVSQGSPVATNASSSLASGTAAHAQPASTDQAMRVLVVGDSVAFTAAQGLSRVGEQSNVAVWNQAKLGCGVLRAERIHVDGGWKTQDPACNDWASRWAGYVDVFQPDAVVILAGTWDVQDRAVGGRKMELGSPESDAFIRSEMDAAIRVLSAAGARVVLLTTPRYQPPRLALAGEPDRFDAARIDHLNALYVEAADASPQTAAVVDLAAFVDDHGGAAALTSDGVHFTADGADDVGRWLVPELASLAPPRAERAASVDGPPASIAAPPRWMELLGLIAGTPEHRAGIVMNDYARFRRAFQVPLPGRDASEQAIDAYYRALMFDAQGARTGVVMAQASGVSGAPLLDRAARRELVDLAADAWSLDGDTRELILAEGSPLCVPGCAGAGEGPSLAVDGRFAILAGALAESGTYTAFISTDTTPYSLGRLAATIAGPDADGATLDSVRVSLAAEPALRPFEAYATGAGVDAGGQFTELVLLHGDEGAARANAELLRERIDAGASWLAGRRYADLIGGADIRVEGRLVVARLRTTSALFWFALPAASDTLLHHE